MTYQNFVEKVIDRAPASSDDAAEKVIEAVLHALSGAVRDGPRQRAASKLPIEIAAMLKVPFESDLGADEIVRRSAEGMGLSAAEAFEKTQVVFQVLAEELEPSDREELAEALNEEVRGWLRPRPRTSPPPVKARTASTARQTLAEGRPGARVPISEGRPGHSQSVANSDNPHGDTKLSSSTGLSQERSGETLAAGRPGSRHPLSESD